LPESPGLLHGADAVGLLAQTVVVTVTVLPITFACVALSDWMTTQPERTIAPTATAAAVRPTRRSRAKD
jgi:hypothetical protein